jgi:hypothetical protein
MYDRTFTNRSPSHRCLRIFSANKWEATAAVSGLIGRRGSLSSGTMLEIASILANVTHKALDNVPSISGAFPHMNESDSETIASLSIACSIFLECRFPEQAIDCGIRSILYGKTSLVPYVGSLIQEHSGIRCVKRRAFDFLTVCR